MTSNVLPTAPSSLVTYGTCPNCEASLPLEAKQCPRCRALFGPDSAWQVQAGAGLGTVSAAAPASNITGDDIPHAGAASTPADASHIGYLTRMVRGELSLEATFWQFQIIWPLLLLMVVLLLNLILDNPVFSVVSGLLMASFNLACLVGLWRAAARRPAGCPKAAAARSWVFLTLAIGAISFLR